MRLYEKCGHTLFFTQPLKPTHPKRNVDSDADLSGIDIQTENGPEKSEVRRGVSDPRPSIPGILDGKKTYQVNTYRFLHVYGRGVPLGHIDTGVAILARGPIWLSSANMT